MKILGLDPGVARLGFGFLEFFEQKIIRLEYGCLESSSKMSPEKRLLHLSKKLGQIINQYQPNYIGLEKLFFAKNSKTAFQVGEARGVILLEIAKKNIPFLELTPLQVKNALTGDGLARKEQIQKMLRLILNLKETPKPDDAADALAIAYSAFTLIKFNALKQK